jgi:hypothetical protein
LGRLATGFSILFGFPLVATGARQAIQGMADSLGFSLPVLKKKHHGVNAVTAHVPLVICILLFCTIISCTVQDVSVVVSLTGAVMGSFIVYICPALIYTQAVAVAKGRNSKEHLQAKWNNLALIPFGLFTAAFGVYMTLQEALVGK